MTSTSAGGNSKKILIVCPYPEGVAAGQRLKYEQYLDDWRGRGYQVDVSPFMSMAMWDIVYQKGNHPKKVLGTLAGITRRIFGSFSLGGYAIVYVFMYVNPLGGTILEKLYRRLANRLIFDLEDNRFIGAHGSTSGIAQKLRATSKTEFLVQHADHVITSSPALNNICLGINEKHACTYITSSVDTDRFLPTGRYSNDTTVTIGWTGTFSTRPFLDLLRPVFIELAKRRKFRLVVIGDFDYAFPEVDLEVIRWSAKNEVSDLQKLDIGVYPLPIDDWVMGKSGLKAIQYMAFGLPCVATDISTVQQFIEDGVNGFLVTVDEQWLDRLTELIDDPQLRMRVGESARETVLARFSKKVVRMQYRSVLEKVSGRLDASAVN